MELTLVPNPLHQEKQTLSFEKVATLIGENGSGKSTILHSIFETKLDGKDYDALRVVCFSSGQNENFSERFGKYLKKERRKGRSLNLECFFYDKSWSKLLIFLATCLHSTGKVREFLRSKGYVEEQEVTEAQKDDISSSLTIKFKVDKNYTTRVQNALKTEESGEDVNTLRATPYFQSLVSFIEKNVDPDYDFDKPLSKRAVELSSDTLFAASYAAARPIQDEDGDTENNRFEDNPTISFFTQAADNDYFIDKANLKLELKGGLELDQLSDGEYQLLFLYALIDLFDAENTLFLLDEVDSHLHYQNIDHLWHVLRCELKGCVITTTHLLDSITANDFDAIKVVEKGCIREDDKLKQLINRLTILSRATSVEFEVCAKITNMALLDDCNDWDIFLRLAKRKGLDISRLNSIYAFKKASSYAATTESFAKAKIEWTENLSKTEGELVTSQVFLICDRDEASLNIDQTNKVKVLGREYSDKIREITRGKNLEIHLLAWNRREIKNYLLSFTALNHHDKLSEINNADLAHSHHLTENDSGDHDGIRRLTVKQTIDPLVNGEKGLCPEKLQAYIDLIPPEEISEDIENMYKFIVGKL